MNKLFISCLLFLSFPAFTSGQKLIAENTRNTEVGGAVNGDME